VLRNVEGGVREGSFHGQFTAVAEGDYRVELRPPYAELDELLVREIRTRVPALEVEKPERNDPVLTDIALSTGGAYYIGAESVVGSPADSLRWRASWNRRILSVICPEHPTGISTGD
jgi:hypothetical protein